MDLVDRLWRPAITKLRRSIGGQQEQFGLAFPREGAIFNHNLRTVVVDAQGRVQKVFIGNEWKVEDLVAEIVKAAAAK